MPLKKFLTEITPDLVSHLKSLRGKTIFNPTILKQNPDNEILAFYGLNCCRIAAKYVGHQLKTRGIEGFEQACDSRNQHSFLIGQQGIIDPTWKQLFSFPAMDYLFENCLFSQDEEVKSEAQKHAIFGRRLMNPHLVEQLQVDIAKQEILMCLDSDEMQDLLNELGERRKEAYQFPDKVHDAMQGQLLGMFDHFDFSRIILMDSETPRASTQTRDPNPAALLATDKKEQREAI